MTDYLFGEWSGSPSQDQWAIMHQYNLRSPGTIYLNDAALHVGNWIGIDEGMTSSEREVYLSQEYNPGQYVLMEVEGHTWGVVNDGHTVLIDEDNDGIFDGAVYYGGGRWSFFQEDDWAH